MAQFSERQTAIDATTEGDRRSLSANDDRPDL